MSLPQYQSGLAFLYYGVQSYFSAQLYSATIWVGIRAYFEQWNQGPGGANRVVFIPGEYHGESTYRTRPYGSLQPALNHRGQATTTPREVGQWTRPITVSVWAPPDTDNPTDELAQNEQTELLFEWTRVAMHTVLAADLTWGNVERVSPPQERGFGEAILIHVEQRGPQFYPANGIAFPLPAVTRSPAS